MCKNQSLINLKIQTYLNRMSLHLKECKHPYFRKNRKMASKVMQIQNLVNDEIKGKKK